MSSITTYVAKKIKETFRSLLHLESSVGASASPSQLYDGAGNRLPITFSTSNIDIESLSINTNPVIMDFQSAPGSVASSHIALYAKSDRKLYIKDSTGTETDLTGGGSVITSTDDVPEGVTNLYYTAARFNSAFGAKSTTDLSEGTNLYYTAARFNTAFGTKTTTDLAEGTNLYYTAARFNTAFAAKTTADLSENTNLYFTDERVDDRVSTLIQNGTGITWSYNDGAGTLTPTISFASFSTTNLSEGTNLYFTDERVDDRVAALIQNGTGITWSYNDGANTLTPTVTITQYTDEMAQDAVGAMVANSTFVSLAYDDSTPYLKGSLSASGTPDATTFLRGDNTWATPAGSGNVSASASLTDNAIVRGDGGTTGIQKSGVIIDDTDNVTGMASLTLPNTGLHLLDTNASHDLVIVPGSDLTADRNLTITTGDAARTLTLNGNPTLNDWFDQSVKTSDTPLFVGVNIANTDTTITRASAGDIAVEGKTVYRDGGTDVALADGGTGASLVDPNADRVMFWDDSAGTVTWLTMGTNLTITGTTLNATSGATITNAEVDLGSTEVAETKVTITDASVSGTSKIIVNVAGIVPSDSRDIEEIFAEQYQLLPVPGAGSFDLYVSPKEGTSSGKFTINYMVG